ncbi:hypothetical protein GCM10007973_04360 [Polymorphobacter multimanifer]|nr:cryptochrome/photolyase family protein [Polymorphobacter multimanifer]GGI70502.1 hypothetical protein GCM10007973_04360 [Polymorphobacter multimanifer]
MTTVIPVLGDQLSLDLASLHAVPQAEAVVLMMEVADEATSVRHHQQKIAFLFSAMRHHAEALRAAGWRVDYVTLDDPDNSQSFAGEIARAVVRHAAARVVTVEAGEWRVIDAQPDWGGRRAVRGAGR